MNVASEALEEMPEPMNDKILFLKLSEAQPGESRTKEPWLDSVCGSFRSTPDFAGLPLQLKLPSRVLPLGQKTKPDEKLNLHPAGSQQRLASSTLTWLSPRRKMPRMVDSMFDGRYLWNLKQKKKWKKRKASRVDSLLKKSFDIALSISSALFSPYLNPSCLLAPG